MERERLAVTMATEVPRDRRGEQRAEKRREEKTEGGMHMNGYTLSFFLTTPSSCSAVSLNHQIRTIRGRCVGMVVCYQSLEG